MCTRARRQGMESVAESPSGTGERGAEGLPALQATRRLRPDDRLAPLTTDSPRKLCRDSLQADRPTRTALCQFKYCSFKSVNYRIWHGTCFVLTQDTLLSVD